MKNKKLIIILAVIGLIVISVIIFLLIRNGVVIDSNNKNAIGVTDITKRSYGYPCISLVSHNSKKITVDAGLYRFGDVNQDGSVDKDDADAISLIINSNMQFTEDQIKLADIDENGAITTNDLNMFNDYNNKNGTVKYSLNQKVLNYCLTTTKNSKNCKWQASNVFSLTKTGTYYIYTKNKTNNHVSTPYEFKISTFENKLPG